MTILIVIIVVIIITIITIITIIAIYFYNNKYYYTCYSYTQILNTCKVGFKLILSNMYDIYNLDFIIAFEMISMCGE